MKARIGLAAVAALVVAAGNAGAASADPGVCDRFLEPQMERYQFFDEETQAVIDSLSPSRPD